MKDDSALTVSELPYGVARIQIIRNWTEARFEGLLDAGLGSDIEQNNSFGQYLARIMAAIIHLLEQEGLRPIVEKKMSESTSAIVYGKTIRFGLFERSPQVKSSPKPNSSSPYSRNPIRIEPTGVLSMEVAFVGGLVLTECSERVRLWTSC
jgi:hypothetical protein